MDGFCFCCYWCCVEWLNLSTHPDLPWVFCAGWLIDCCRSLWLLLLVAATAVGCWLGLEAFHGLLTLMLGCILARHNVTSQIISQQCEIPLSFLIFILNNKIKFKNKKYIQITFVAKKKQLKEDYKKWGYHERKKSLQKCHTSLEMINSNGIASLVFLPKSGRTDGRTDVEIHVFVHMFVSLYHIAEEDKSRYGSNAIRDPTK